MSFQTPLWLLEKAYEEYTTAEKLCATEKEVARLQEFLIRIGRTNIKEDNNESISRLISGALGIPFPLTDYDLLNKYQSIKNPKAVKEFLS